jgi:hypothetical protein
MVMVMVKGGPAVFLVPAVVVSLAVVASPATGTAQAATSPWRIAAAPNPSSSTYNILNAVVMTRRHGWAVGAYETAHATRTLVERYSAATGRWTVVPSPNPPGGGALSDVTGDDADAWAVGGGFAMHWNGSAWHAATLPRVNGELTGISMRSSSDVWAVGARSTASGATVPWTAHWNGSHWAAVAAPNPGAASTGTAFEAVAVVPGTSQVIAVGTANGRGRGSGNAFVERWTGRKWVIASIPSVPGKVDDLTSVVALSRTDAWAVGSVYSASPHTLALHWNGTAWKRVTTPDPGNGEFTSIAGSGATSLWAAGDDQPNGSTWTTPLIEHWNGHSWTDANAPAAPVGKPGHCGLSDGYQGLLGIAATPGAAAATAVGYHDQLSCGTPRRTLLEQHP